MGSENFSKFIQYIVEQDAVPISLKSTQAMLRQRKQMEQMQDGAKDTSKAFMTNISEIASAIIDTKVNAAFID